MCIFIVQDYWTQSYKSCSITLTYRRFLPTFIQTFYPENVASLPINFPVLKLSLLFHWLVDVSVMAGLPDNVQITIGLDPLFIVDGQCLRLKIEVELFEGWNRIRLPPPLSIYIQFKTLNYFFPTFSENKINLSLI